jgi:hypothetical protein
VSQVKRLIALVSFAGAFLFGSVDGFYEDEAESKGNNGTVVLGRLLVAERHALEPLERCPQAARYGRERDRVPSGRTAAGSGLMI